MGIMKTTSWFEIFNSIVPNKLRCCIISVHSLKLKRLSRISAQKAVFLYLSAPPCTDVIANGTKWMLLTIDRPPDLQRLPIE